MIRDNHVESLWQGSATVANCDGKIIRQIGDDTDFPIITRSSIKPIHAIVLADWMQENNIPFTKIKPEEWVLLCASHSGTPENRAHLSNLLKRFDIPQSKLICGEHAPLDTTAFEQALISRRVADSLDHQCAGHHAGQLILSKLMGLPLDDYANPEGPLQQYYLKQIQSLIGQSSSGQTNTPKAKLLKWDGCNIPTTAIPMAEYAKLYSKFATLPASKALWAYIETNSDVVSRLIGKKTNVDSLLIKATGGRLFAKAGNDGVLCVIRRCEHSHQKGEAVVLKLWSGIGNEDLIRDKVAVQALSDLGWLKREEVDNLRKEASLQLHQYGTKGIATGQEKVRYLTHPLPWKQQLNTIV
jgi:L-asparaginase II